MSTAKNQTTLFRFQTLRSPELSNKINQGLRFVFHPYNPEDNTTIPGVFIEAVNAKPPTQTIWSALLAEAESFIPLNKTEDFEQFNLDFNETAVWLSKNKNSHTPQEIIDRIQDIPVLTDVNETIIWDNLFFQIVTQQSFYAKELAIEWLVLQNALQKLAEFGPIEEKREVIASLADAKVILPTLLFGEKPQIGLTNKITVGKDFFESQQLRETYAAFNNKFNVLKIEKALTEIKKAEKKYIIEDGKLLKAYQQEYDIEVAEIMKTYSAAYLLEAKNICALPVTPSTSDFCKTPFVNHPEMPEYKYVPLDVYFFLKNNLSSDSYNTMESVVELGAESTFDDVYEALIDEIETHNKALAGSQFNTSKRVMAIGDIVIPSDYVNRDVKIPYKLCVNRYISGRFIPYLTIVPPDPGYQVLSCRYTLILLDASTYTSEATTLIPLPSGTQLEFLFHNAIPLPISNTPGLPISMGNTIQEISGTVTFTNGIVRTFKAENIGTEALNCASGYMGVKDSSPDDEDSGSADSFVPTGFGFRQLGISDYKKVVQEICCYKAGEVAHIENIMAREFKEKTTEKITTQETTTFESEEIESESLTDSISTQRFEMQTEIAKILQEQQQFSAYANVQGSAGTTTFDAGGSYASNVSQEESNRQAVTQAKEITERAMERIVSRIKKEKTVKITESFKDTNSHIFDNREGTEHVSGVFRFVNAIYKNQVYNYGKRLMYEFMIPQPSKLHRLGKGASSSDLNAQILDVPLDPRTHGIKDFRDVNSGNYMELASKYAAEVETYPSQYAYINKTFAGGVEIKWEPERSGGVLKEEANLKIPDGYKTSKATIRAERDYDDTFYRSFGVGVGGIKLWMGATQRTYTILNQSLHPFSETISVSVQTLNSIGYNVTISIRCEITPEAIIKWKKETFDAILAGYQQQLLEYNERLAQIKSNGVQILDSNPLFYRQIEQLVLRKNCISYLIDDTNEQSKRRFGRMMYNQDAVFTTHQVTVDKEMDDYGSFAKFMEQAFEWNNISYNFYPFYWGNRGDWDELYQYETNDPTFRSFMQAGLARVVVTVKPGFEDAVMHYMAFGQIWNGGRLPILGDPLYLSIVDELKEQEYTIEESWETVLPTHLIALQKSGVALTDVGLPCSPECLDDEENPFIENKEKLGVSEENS